MTNIGGEFVFKKYNQFGELEQTTISENIVVDEFTELIASRLFKTNLVSGYSDTRYLNKFIVGYSDEPEDPTLTYNEMKDRAITITPESTEILNDITPIDFNTNYAQTKRVLKLQFESPSGMHVGQWRELGLVSTGISGEDPSLFCRTTGFDMSKASNNVITAEYYIVF